MLALRLGSHWFAIPLPPGNNPRGWRKGIEDSTALVPGWFPGTFVKWTPVCPKQGLLALCLSTEGLKVSYGVLQEAQWARQGERNPG